MCAQSSSSSSKAFGAGIGVACRRGGGGSLACPSLVLFRDNGLED